ncbi:MAG: transcriptional repressor, partial [Proteobacteria bacterium]|nr:transcriptional repressor [Pseudomonadota bacterium]
MITPNNLKTVGLKTTLPRLKILNLFENAEVRHLSAEDVYKMLIGEG